MKRSVVKLRVYKKIEGRGGILRNEKGVVENENQIVSLFYNTPEWYNYVGSISSAVYAKVEVESYHVQDGKGYKEADTPDEITIEIDNAFKAPEKELTKEQREIKELKEQVALLLKAKSATANVVKENPFIDNSDGKGVIPVSQVEEDLNNDYSVTSPDKDYISAREDYKKEFGRYPHKKWDTTLIREKIQELKAS